MSKSSLKIAVEFYGHLRSFKDTARNIKYTSLKIIIKILSALIPNKKLRKMVRKNLTPYDKNALRKAIDQLPYKPIVKDTDETIEEIVKNKKSICRFGDGEFLLIKGKSIPFQDADNNLKNRLVEILNSDDEKTLIGINYLYWNIDNIVASNLYGYSERFLNNFAAKNLSYITSLLDPAKTYYRSDFTSIYASTKEYDFDDYFRKIRSLWEERDITIICGKHVFDEIENSIFSNANSINYQYAPTEHAFLEYDKILEAALTINKERLVICILGPTATVLSFDLTKNNYQALDLGHIAKDYDYFLKKMKMTVSESFKYTDQPEKV